MPSIPPRPRLQVALLLAACLALPSAARADDAAPAPAQAPAAAPEVRTVSIPSEAMKRELPATVVLPASYAAEPGRRYPVVYLLHGAGDTHTGWVEPKKGDAAYLADRHQAILVLPTGGMGWYYDTAHAGAYETHVAKEVVAWVDAHLRTIQRRGARAVAGLSMGGHGALWLGMRHPETFGAMGAMSGGVDVRDWAAKDSWGLKKLLGDDPKAWEAHSGVVQAPKLLKPGASLLLVDCGTEDFFLKDNRDLHQALLAAKIPHVYTERPGGHAWPVWREAVKGQMLAFGDMFAEDARRAAAERR